MELQELLDELDHFLNSDVILVDDALQWWYDHRTTYPWLSRMALDYLTIPATSVAVERVFSHGWLLLTHVRNGMSAQTLRSVMCLGEWSMLGLVKDKDAMAVTSLPEVDEGVVGDVDMEEGWDAIGNML